MSADFQHSGLRGCDLGGEKLLPGSTANGPVRGQVGAGTNGVRRRAGHSDSDDDPPLADCLQVAAQQVLRVVDLWSANVWRLARRWTERQLHEVVRDLIRVNRLESRFCRERHDRKL